MEFKHLNEINLDTSKTKTTTCMLNTYVEGSKSKETKLLYKTQNNHDNQILS